MNFLIKVELERLDCESRMLQNKPSCEMIRGGFYSFFRTVNYFCLYFGFRVSSSADNSIYQQRHHATAIVNNNKGAQSTAASSKKLYNLLRFTIYQQQRHAITQECIIRLTNNESFKYFLSTMNVVNYEEKKVSYCLSRGLSETK